MSKVYPFIQRLSRPVYDSKKITERDLKRVIQKYREKPYKVLFYLEKIELGNFLVKIVPWLYGIYRSGVRFEVFTPWPKEFIFFSPSTEKKDVHWLRHLRNLGQFAGMKLFHALRKEKDNVKFAFHIKGDRFFNAYFFKKNEFEGILDDWVPPPFKEHYRSKGFIFEKPILVIQNKFNTEPAKNRILYGKEKKRPVNYIPLDLLVRLFERYRKDYQIVYNRFHLRCDASRVFDLGDFELIRNKYPDVLTIQELMQQKGLGYNETQLRVYANCERFIGVQGGGSVIFYYFGGKSLTFHYMPDDLYEEVVSGRRVFWGAGEIRKNINFYESVFPRLSGQEIEYARDIQTFENLALNLF